MKYFDRTSQLATMDNLNRIEEWVEMWPPWRWIWYYKCLYCICG